MARMPEAQHGADGQATEPRESGERGRRSVRGKAGGRPVQVDPARQILAKLLSTLLGTFIGLIAAYGLSTTYISTFVQLRDQAQAKYTSLSERNAENKVELAQKEARLDGPKSGLTEEEIAELRTSVRELRSETTRVEDQLLTLGNEIEETHASIRLLDTLAAILLLLSLVVGYSSHELVLRLLGRIADNWLALTGGQDLRSPQALVGFIAGMSLAVVVLLAAFNTLSLENTLLSNPLFRLIIGAVVVVILGWFGSVVGLSYFGTGQRRTDPYRDFRSVVAPKILDSSVLIDGRLFEVATSGFLDGQLVVPSSVLRELQNLADSSDGRRRAKGRRGLELVRTMQDDPRVEVKVFDDSPLYEAGRPTDDQLITIAKAMGGVVVTNDFNLNRVAAIHNVRVLNLNALAQAVKTRLLPGDMLELDIVDRGKQRGQGVGYLDDGTMVVVEDGEPFIGQHRTIKLTSVTQTQQGRLMFGRVDLAEEDGENGHGRNI